MALIVSIMINDQTIAHYGVVRVSNTERRPHADDVSDYEITDIRNERILGLVTHRYGDGAHLLVAKVMEACNEWHYNRLHRGR